MLCTQDLKGKDIDHDTNKNKKENNVLGTVLGDLFTVIVN